MNVSHQSTGWSLCRWRRRSILLELSEQERENAISWCERIGRKEARNSLTQRIVRRLNDNDSAIQILIYSIYIYTDNAT